MLIREVILENFMSYEYARVYLKEGVNVIVGPNGSGKSSFLLGICVALGDTYTERSKKLSDLIRWGQDRGRVSLLLDNTVREDGKRSIPRFDNDIITLTRNLRRDGKYWFEINHKFAQKYEVIYILKRLGFDPTNMLIIMHQNMPMQFAGLSSIDKLKTLETAVGLESYRSDIIEAKRKLSGILSEEKSLNELLGRARETLAHWRDQYERLQDKRQHQTRSFFLQREFAWSRVISIENIIKKVEQELEKTEADLYKNETEFDEINRFVIDSQTELRKNHSNWSDLIENRIKIERTIGICEHNISSGKERIIRLDEMLKESAEQWQRFETKTENLKKRLKAGPTTLDDFFYLFEEIEETQTNAFDSWNLELKTQHNNLMNSIKDFTKQLNAAESEVKDVIHQITTIQNQINDINEKYIDSRIRLALIKDRRNRLNERINDLKSELDYKKQDLNDVKSEAIIKGPRIETGRLTDEIIGDMRKISGILMGLADVSEEAETMYESYSRTFQELQEKIEQVRETRKQVMLEIEERTKKWLELMKGLLKEMSNRYQSLLTMLQATGEVKIVNTNDIEEAGLEIWVGFKGAQPSKLDPYTHSGGERSTSVMTFLLALQQNILSPFRAVDEFDLHMDPKNRELISEFIVQTMKGSNEQYIAITPSQVTFNDKDVHLIMVHKTDGISTAQLVDHNESK